MLVQIEGLHFRYPGVSELALTDIHLNVGEGEFVAVVGPAGAGKTTLAACVNGTIPHFQGGEWAGSVILSGHATSELSPKDLAQLVGTVSSDPERQMVAVSVEEEVAFGLENLCLPRREIELRLCEALEMVGASHLRYRATCSLSGGEKGRVALAAILALRPRLLILDEPVAELDPAGAQQVMSAITSLHRRLGTTIIHFESRLANVVEYARRLVLMNSGRIIADGPMREIVYNQEFLADAGLTPPPITQAVLAGRKAGILFDDGNPLTIYELQRVIAKNQPNVKQLEQRGVDYDPV